MDQNPGRRIARLTFGALLNKAWGKAASAENAISGFKTCGVTPFNPEAIPDYAFFDSLAEPNSRPYPPTSSRTTSLNQNSSAATILNQENIENEPIPGTSTEQNIDNVNWTPSKILKELSPIPQKLTEARKRSKQVGKLLTSNEHIAMRKIKEEEKRIKEN